MSDIRKKLGIQAGIVSIITNILLFAIKMWAGIVSGSLALIADAWHTLSDSLSSVIVIFSVKISSRKPDKNHPFGYGRWEQISSIFIAFLLAIVSYEFIRESIDKFNNRESAQFGTLAIIVTIISIITKEALAQYSFFIGKKTDNSTIKADGWHHRSDALSSIVILLGILFKSYFWWIDSVLGFVVSLMLMHAAYTIVKEAIVQLLGKDAPVEFIKEIKELINEVYKEDLNAHHFHIHNYGGHKEMTFHLMFDPSVNLQHAHNVATLIEQAIYKKYRIITTIHMEPVY